MTNELPPPTSSQAEAVERFADALYALLAERSRSWGVVEIGVETNGWYIDAELLFASGPDMGLSVHAAAGEAQFCMLVDEACEQWTDHVVSDLQVINAGDDDALRTAVLAVMEGLLAARRPLLHATAHGGAAE